LAWAKPVDQEATATPVTSRQVAEASLQCWR